MGYISVLFYLLTYLHGVFSRKCWNVGGERQTGIPITAHAHHFHLGQKMIAKLLRTLTGLFTLFGNILVTFVSSMLFYVCFMEFICVSVWLFLRTQTENH